MRTLALKRKYKGIYEVENDKIKISLSNPYSATGFGTNAWELIIDNKKNMLPRIVKIYISLESPSVERL